MSQNNTGWTDELSEDHGHAGILRETLACGLIACDGAGKISVFSPEAESLLKLKSAAVLGNPLTVLPAPLQKIITKALAGGQNVTQQIVAEGQPEPITLRVQVAIIAGVKNHPEAIILLNDVTTARRLQHNIARLDRLANLGTLSASLAHEIKNGLVAAKTFVELLLEKNQDAELAEVVGREMTRIDALVSQMLRVAMPVRPGMAPVAVHELLDHTLRLVQHQLDDKLIALRRDFHAQPDVIHGNSHQLEQVFMNLLLNAVEAMGPNGELTVSTQMLPAVAASPARLEITFRDTGIGIEPENLGRLFDTFFTTKKNGTGLGLAITRRIALEHHGEVAVESRPNEGAIFKLTLPLGNSAG